MARKPKAVNSSSTNSDGADLGLSELRIRLNFLEKENEKLLKQIEKNRTELSNLTNGIQDLGREIAQRSAPLMMKMAGLDQQIHAVFEEIFTGRKLGKKTRKDIESIYYHLQSDGLLTSRSVPGEEEEESQSKSQNHSQDFNPEDDPDWEYFNQRSQREQQEDHVKLDREELKKIRQTFLQLAEIFHPDKVTDPVEKEYCTEVMKEINQAYQTGDLAKLLAIKKKQELNEVIDRDNSDHLERHCARVEAENSLLKEQLENSKKELRLTKRTEAGGMLTQYKKLAKSGEDPVGIALEEMEEQVKIVDDLHKFVIEFRDRRITIKEFLKGPKSLVTRQYITEEELLEMLMRA